MLLIKDIFIQNIQRKESKNIFPKANITRSDIFRKKYKHFLGKNV